MFDTEEEGYLKQEEISKTNVTIRSQGLIKEDRSVLPIKIPEFIITSQNPKQINMPVNPIEENTDDVKRISKHLKWGMILWKT